MEELEGYITHVIQSASRDVILDRYVDQMVQSVMDAVYDEVTSDPGQ